MSDQKTAGGSAGKKQMYRKTLNLPQTDFPMRAGLVKNEPASLARWTKLGLYDRLRELGEERREARGAFVFHDGPPYANGSIHMGHLMNKCLKDFVVRSRSMMGFDCPFVPGWDCHGLPIEYRVMTDLETSGEAKRMASLPEDERRMAIRSACHRYAMKYVQLHKEQMQRLLTMADYDHPYLTLDPAYEGATLEVLATLVERGLVFRALKPVHWSVANETALAEAELEYHDREDVSVYVDFEAADPQAVYDAFGLPADSDDPDEDSPRPGMTPSLMIWTTTPWTLPANLAVSVHPRIEYALVRMDGNVTVLASELVEKVGQLAKAESVEVLGRAPGEKLLGLRYRHPFVTSPPAGCGGDSLACFRVIAAEYVTTEDGTGLVHTAPGHGTEDYQSGQREGLPIYCPVMGDGRYDETVPEWLRGQEIWQANAAIVESLRASGHLFHDHKFMHSYPHDWRSKTPVIFRCTDQWFIGVDMAFGDGSKSLRQMALDACDEQIKYVPSWGRGRMRGMIESRPDWCISRQRSWGLPIPAFFTPDGAVFMTPASVRAVARVIRERGSDAWFTESPATLLAEYDPASDPEAPSGLDLGSLSKGPDILDVWFESGSSWNAVMRERSGGQDFPVRLYLEGSDQHRGWFQTSLLPSLGVMGRPPYETLLTHGFMVDKDGRKLSKSMGDTVEDLFNDYGADVLRWWVFSLAYENDVKVDREFFNVAGESYRKVRNTLRFMLGNLDGFTPERGVDPASLAPTSIEAWALGRFNDLLRTVTDAFERYDFRKAHQELYRFCAETMSAVYLAATKDRLYCEKPDSPKRLATQTALWIICDGLCKLLAPVLCHTADEAYRSLLGVGADDEDTCVHLETVPEPVSGVAEDREAWAEVMRIREAAQGALERAKGEMGVENPLDAGLTLPDPKGVLARFGQTDLVDVMGVSRVTLDSAAESVSVHDLRSEPRCERSWKRDGTVRERADGGMLSDRDAAALGVA